MSSAQVGINDFIINDSFGGGADPYISLEGKSSSHDFVQDVNIINGDFAPVSDSKAKKLKFLKIAVATVLVIGSAAIAAIKFYPLLTQDVNATPGFPLEAAGGSTKSGQEQTLIQIPPTGIQPQPPAVTAPLVQPEPIATPGATLIPAPVSTASTPVVAIVAPQITEPSGGPKITQQQAAPIVASPVSVPSGSIATPTPAPVPVAANALPVTVVETKPAPVIAQQHAEAKKIVTAQPTQKPSSAPRDQKPVPSGKPLVANQSNHQIPKDDGGVKPLVTITAAEIGLRFFTADELSVSAKGANKAATYRVGDTLRSGELIQHLDPSSMTIVTDRRVLRIN
jgi:hypothetical protein